MSITNDQANDTYGPEGEAQQAWQRFTAEGSDASFEWLYRHFIHLLLDYGYKICQERWLVEDAVQNLFTYLLVHRKQLPVPRSVKYYLLRCIRNEILKLLRKHSREQPEQGLFETALQLTPMVAPELEKYLEKESLQQLQAYINQLPARQKEVIYLRFYHGLTYAEVAAVMGIDQRSAYKTIYKALDNLRRLLPASARSGLYVLLQHAIFIDQLFR